MLSSAGQDFATRAAGPSARTWSQPELLRPARAPGPQPAYRNSLLAALPAAAAGELHPLLERVPLRKRQMLQESNLPLSHAYFIEQGAASLACRSTEKAGLEIGTLGPADFVGVPLVLGTLRSPHRCIVQVPGEAFRIRADDLARAIHAIPELRKLLFGYVQVTMVHSAQLAVCNSRHSLQQRLARWLLIAHDQLGRDEIPMTHQCLSRALGVRRAGVTTLVGKMEVAGLLRKGRGELVVADRAGLEAQACECYRAISSEHRRIICEPLAAEGGSGTVVPLRRVPA